jgi:hypothetical protein
MEEQATNSEDESEYQVDEQATNSKDESEYQVLLYGSRKLSCNIETNG